MKIQPLVAVAAVAILAIGTAAAAPVNPSSTLGSAPPAAAVPAADAAALQPAVAAGTTAARRPVPETPAADIYALILAGLSAGVFVILRRGNNN